MQASRIVVVMAAVAAAAGGCAVEPGSGGDDVGVVILAQTGDSTDEDPCPPNGCGGNSPVIDGVYFWRLAVDGRANPEGVKITGARNMLGDEMRLESVPGEGDRLRGVGLVPPYAVTEHTSLIGTRIALSVRGLPYEILINWVAPDERFWVVDGTAQIESYELLYRPISGAGDERPQALCSEDDGQPAKLRALVFAGDLYNPKTKGITVGPTTDGWLNIACTGSAIYKMHKIGYTTAAETRLGIATSVGQRRAMLNAWTSNVCGTGRSFTQPGEPLTLREAQGLQLSTSPYLAASVTREAIWSEAGAVCLNTHRREEDEPNIYTEIAQECGGQKPPSCATYWGTWPTYGTVITGSPAE